MLYERRRRPGQDRAEHFEILFGVKPRFVSPGDAVLAHARLFELAMALINRAERLVPRTLQKEAGYQIGDMLLCRSGKQPEGSKFDARVWLGPFKVISVERPGYALENALARRSTEPVHFKRLRRYQKRDAQHSDGGKNW